uniref:Uncharacterized protein n=1 Tax=Anguilla anguilla TaxID=7936 RepID=A0A0E9UY00_ANGAN
MSMKLAAVSRTMIWIKSFKQHMIYCKLL